MISPLEKEGGLRALPGEKAQPDFKSAGAFVLSAFSIISFQVILVFPLWKVTHCPWHSYSRNSE